MTWIYLVIAGVLVAVGIWVALRKERKSDGENPPDSGLPPQNPPANPPDSPGL
ncbi:MAG: hypothetical protein V1845_00955 [bacterium]